LAALASLLMAACASPPASRPDPNLAQFLATGSAAQRLSAARATPLAETGQTEKAAATPTGALERVQADPLSVDGVFPPPSATVPAIWNGWYVNHAIDAFRVAIEENKPLVIVIGEDWCKYCGQLAFQSLRCPNVDRFAGEAIFAFSFV